MASTWELFGTPLLANTGEVSRNDSPSMGSSGVERVLDGFRSAPPVIIKDSSVRQSTTAAQLVYSIMRRTRFYPFDGFLSKVVRAKDALQLVLDGLEHSEASCVARNRNCKQEWCSELCRHKGRIADAKIRTEVMLSTQTFNLVCIADSVLSTLRPGWNVEVTEGVELTTCQFPTPSNSSPSGGVKVIPDVGVHATNQDYPDSVLEVKLPSSEHLEKLLRVEEPSNRSSLTALQTTKVLQRHFTDICVRLREDNLTNTTDWLVNVICQAILQAMHTRSGYGCVWCYGEALMLKVESGLKDGFLDVYVLPLFPSEGATSTYHALFAYLVSAQEDASESTLRSLAETVGEIQRKGSTFTLEIPEMDHLHGVHMQPSPGSFRYPRRSNGRHGYQEDGLLDEGENDFAMLNRRGKEVYRVDIRSENDALAYMERGDLIDVTPKQLEAIFVRNCFMHISCGGSGKLSRGFLGKFDIVLKQWNGRSLEGLDQLKNEMSIYKKVHSEHKSLLGDAIPQVFAICSGPTAEDLAIVLEYVGESVYDTLKITRDKDGRRRVEMDWRVGKQILEPSEEREIAADATRGLRLLSMCGIIHEDRSVRNIRVRRVLEENRQRWKVWWLDFGVARIEEPRKLRLQWKLSHGDN